MTQLSREKLEEIAELARKANYKPCAVHMTNLIAVCDSEVIEEMARRLLAVDKQEPVAVIDKDGNPMTRFECNDDRIFAICCKVGTPLYAAPQPAPVAQPIGITDKSEIECLMRGEMANVMPPDYKGVDAGDEVYLYDTPVAQPVQAPDDEQLRALFDAWFASDCSFDRSPDATEEDNIAWRESYWYVWQRCRAAMLKSEPVSQPYKLPDGYVLVPKKLTADNGAKSVMSGEFSETKFINCPECFGDEECETCDGSGRIEITLPVSWTNIKAIWEKAVDHFAAAPQEPTK